MGQSVYLTTYGREVPVVPVGILLIQKIQEKVRVEFEKKGMSLSVPQYCVTVGESKQCYDHDEISIKDEHTPQEEKDAWTAYQENLLAYNRELTERMLGAIIMDQPIQYDEGWEEKLEWLGLDIPEYELDRKLLFVTTLVLKSAEDIGGYMNAVIQESAKGVSAEAIAAARSMFSG